MHQIEKSNFLVWTSCECPDKLWLLLQQCSAFLATDEGITPRGHNLTQVATAHVN